MNKKKLLIIIAVLVVLFIGVAALYGVLSENYVPEGNGLPNQSEASDESEGSSGSEKEPIPAPDFTVYDGNGNAVNLSDFLGKPVVINFWATWCGYCKQEMPAFEKLSKEYGDEVVFMMINVTDGQQETKEDAVAFIKDNGYTFPVYYDVDLEATYTYGAYSLPATGFISAEGDFLGGHTGAMSEEMLRGYIEQLLG